MSIAKALVDDADSVRVMLTPNSVKGLTVHPQVSEHDLGKVIGKQGRTARSLRTILQAASMKHHQRFLLEINASVEAFTL